MADKMRRPTIHRVDTNWGKPNQADVKVKDLVQEKHRNWVHSGMIAEVNLATKRGRRLLAMYAQYVADKGGEDSMSFAEKEICRRCATLGMLAADIEEDLVKDKDGFDDRFSQYILIAKTLMQCIKELGNSRISRDAKVITLEDYLADTSDGQLEEDDEDD